LKPFNVAVTLAVAATLSSACGGRGEPSIPNKSTPVPTIASELATFRSGMTVQPHTLAGPTSRDSLVRLFERALTKSDTAGLDDLQITREEFAYLYYPESRMARPPYELGPDVMWMQIQSQRDQGLRRLVSKYGGMHLGIRRVECQPPERQNAVAIYQCGILTSEKGDTTAKQLFGSIIERDGRFKFVGYANRM
jgi:hypothetical protein